MYEHFEFMKENNILKMNIPCLNQLYYCPLLSISNEIIHQNVLRTQTPFLGVLLVTNCNGNALKAKFQPACSGPVRGVPVLQGGLKACLKARAKGIG